MKKYKRRIETFVFLVFAMGVLNGCTTEKGENIVIESRHEKTQSQAELTFFGFKYEALNVLAIENTLHSFMDENPDISILYDGIKSPEYFEVLEKRLDTGNGDDIFMVDHERVLELENDGILADLSDISTLDNFSDLAKSQMKADGDVNYIPTSISAFGLYCNLDLLEEYGQEVPQNIKELQTVCDYFVSRGITPIVANNDISLKTVAIAKGMLPFYQHGNTDEAINKFNDSTADLAEALSPGFELVEEIIQRGWVNSEEALDTAKTKDDLLLFAEGDQPFMLSGVWAVPRLRDLGPDFDFEVTPYPILEDGSVLVINIDTRVSVRADSPYLTEAKQFVEYLTQKDVMWEFVNSQSSFSPLKENRLGEDEAIQSIGPYLTNNRSVIGSDDNLQYPIWEMTRQCIVGMLEGDDAQQAVLNFERQIKDWKSSNGR